MKLNDVWPADKEALEKFNPIKQQVIEQLRKALELLERDNSEQVSWDRFESITEMQDAVNLATEIAEFLVS